MNTDELFKSVFTRSWVVVFDIAITGNAQSVQSAGLCGASGHHPITRAMSAS
jgi:hypothetical protein